MINDAKNASKETFWSLIKKYYISIPRMQRNYAQGRKEPEINQKRENLLNDIFDALNNKKSLDLNFVYGNEYKLDNDKVLFVPIDGQQRLTTLFLLYWYFLILSNSKTEETKNILLKFTYETRDVTKQFCQKLINEVDLDLEKITNDDLINTIKDYYWFFSDFDYDSSISSMLVMLQSIHEKTRKIGFEKCKSYFELLISDQCPITFLFLNIDNVGLTDEIYIKMNARGKPLTEFENFKAQLTNYLSKKDHNFSELLLAKINCERTQFFWSITYNGENIIFDIQIMNFIKFIMFNDFICNNQAPNSNERMDIRKTIRKLRYESTFEFTNRLFRDEFKIVESFENSFPVIDELTFKKIYKLINALSYRYKNTGSLKFLGDSKFPKVYFDEDEFFKKIISSHNFDALPYENLVLLYAEYAFIIQYSNEDGTFDKNDELTSWIRYIYNLSRAQLYNQQDDYYRSIRSINEMIKSNYALNINEFACSMIEKGGFGFFDLQVKEESIKAILMSIDDEWKKLIIDAENSYLGNQLSSIINFSGIEDDYDTNLSIFKSIHPNVSKIPNNYKILTKKITKNKFIKYLNKINILFNKDGLKEEFEVDQIFRRALLTFGGIENSYLLIKEGQNYSFLNNSDRDYSFKRLLRDNNNEKRKYFQQVLDNISDVNDIQVIKDELNKMIDEFINNPDSKNSWKYYFVSLTEILNCIQSNGKPDPSGEFVFKNNGRFINMKNKNEILLCEGKSTRSMNRELYTYVLYLKAKERNLNVKYVKDFTETKEKYLTFKNKDNLDIRVIFKEDKYVQGNYQFFALHYNDSKCNYSNMENILNYIEKEILK